MKIVPAEFKRKINFLEETQQNQRQMLTGKELVFQVHLLFNINKTQEHTMNWSDILTAELYNDNLKMFN